MKNMLVTGGCGFIGANFIRYILDETSFAGRIINVDKLTYAGNPASLEDIALNYTDRYLFEQIDICDARGIKRVFDRYSIDSVCHFAAESHVDRSIASPEVFVDTNVKGTFNLIEASRLQPGFLRFHHVSTDEVYGSLGKTGYFTETTAYAPSSPYSASKASSDHLVRAYFHTYGLNVTISNCSNNYGPFQFPEKLIPLMILNALEEKPLPVYGDGSNVRDWLYVRDHCRAIWTIMCKGRSGETYNVGGECEVENLKIVRLICDMIDRSGRAGHSPEFSPDDSNGSSRDLICFVKDRPGHDFRYAIDCTKLKNELGWRPEESFDTGMEKSVAWYLNNLEWVKKIQSGDYLDWIKNHYSKEEN